jgi:hypothetical protein
MSVSAPAVILRALAERDSRAIFEIIARTMARFEIVHFTVDPS